MLMKNITECIKKKTTKSDKEMNKIIAIVLKREMLPMISYLSQYYVCKFSKKNIICIISRKRKKVLCI